jgi:hypothetical protein
MTKNRPAQRGDWKTEPLPAQRTTLHIDRTYSAQEMKRIRQGLIPEAMEDKWFIFFEDDVLYLHRSWTGYCMYEAHLVKKGDGWRVDYVLANRDPDQYNVTDDDKDVDLFVFLVDLLLLGTLSTPPHLSGDRPNTPEHALALWSLVGRAITGGGPGVDTSGDEGDDTDQ